MEMLYYIIVVYVIFYYGVDTFIIFNSVLSQLHFPAASRAISHMSSKGNEYVFSYVLVWHLEKRIPDNYIFLTKHDFDHTNFALLLVYGDSCFVLFFFSLREEKPFSLLLTQLSLV